MRCTLSKCFTVINVCLGTLKVKCQQILSKHFNHSFINHFSHIQPFVILWAISQHTGDIIFTRSFPKTPHFIAWDSHTHIHRHVNISNSPMVLVFGLCGNRRTWGKLTQTQGEHENST